MLTIRSVTALTVGHCYGGFDDGVGIMGPLKGLFDVINGARSAVQHGSGLVVDVAHGEIHKAVTDGRALMGDVGDILKGLPALGAGLGPVPSLYAESPFGKLSDSRILSAAQLVIEGERKLTGSGEPEDAKGYRTSSKQLDRGDTGSPLAVDAVGALADASPHEDRWDGRAAQVYRETNDTHRHHASDVSVADGHVATIIGTEAGQISRTRKTLDDTSQNLYEYGLATAWMNFVPGGGFIKLGLDMAAATAALATANTTMAVLVKNVAENAWRLHSQIEAYESAAQHKVGPVMAGEVPAVGAAFVPQQEDLADRPRRLDPSQPLLGWPAPEKHGGPLADPLPSAPPVEYPNDPLSMPAPRRGER